jgi:hypothetical protein
MSENRISLKFTDAEITQIKDAIGVLVALLAPKLIALSDEDKKRLSKISDSSIPFNEKVAQYVVSNPEFVPMFLKADDFLTDFSAFKELRGFIRLLEQVFGNMQDSSMLAGSEADDFARAYYGAVGQAAKMGVPNAQAIYDDLSERYEGQRKPRARQTPKSEPEEE